MRKGALYVVIIAAVLGGVLSALSTSQHFRIQREGLEVESYCVISDRINCDLVNASSYSEFLGVPIAWWGLLFYGIVGVFAIIAIVSRRDRRDIITIAWLMSVAGLFYCAFLAYITFFILETVCLECLGMYVATIALAIALFIALRIPLGGVVRFVIDYVRAVFGRPSHLEFKPRIWKNALIIALVYLVGWVAIAQVQAKEGAGRRRMSVAEMVRAFNLQSEHEIEIDPNWAVWGNPNAKVTIVEFSEYQCPFCRLSAFHVKPYLQEFKNDIRYYFVNYPLDSTCNARMAHQMHPLACFAAEAAICVENKGKFWSFHDELFRNQRGLTREFILNEAERIGGYDRDELVACMSSPEVAERIQNDLAVGQKIYVSGTPTLFLNNRKLTRWRDKDFLRTIVRDEIRKSRP